MAEEIPLNTNSRTAIPPRAIRFWTMIGIFGVISFIAIVIFLHAVNPELDPRSRFISEYALGKQGWLLTVALLGNFTACVALLILLHSAYQPPHRSWTCIIGVGITILASTILTAIFPADIHGNAVSMSGHVHNLAGLLGTLSMLIVMIVFSIRRQFAGPLGGVTRLLLPLAFSTPVAFFIQMILSDKGPGWAGIGQRVLSVLMLTWLLIVFLGIRSGSLLPGHRRPGRRQADHADN